MNEKKNNKKTRHHGKWLHNLVTVSKKHGVTEKKDLVAYTELTSG